VREIGIKESVFKSGNFILKNNFYFCFFHISHAYFTWSFYDTVAQEAEEWRNDFYQNYGILTPSETITYTPTKKLKVYPIENLKNLIEFMTQGRAFYYTHFDKQLKKFYDKRRDDKAI